MHRQTLVAGFTVALLVAACTASVEPDPDLPDLVDITAEDPDPTPDPEPDPPDPDPESQPDTDPPDEQDTTPDDDPTEDPFAIPDPIDEAYVELVMNELLARGSDLEREILQRPLRTALLEADVIAAQAIYEGPSFRTRTDALQDLLNSEERRALALPPEEYGSGRIEVVELGDTSVRCIVVFGWLDATETARYPFEPETHAAYVLIRTDEAGAELNPTPWKIWDSVMLVTPDGEDIPREAWAGLEFRESLDTSCGEDD